MQWMYVFLWMFVVKEKKMSKFITDNIDISSDDSDKKTFGWRNPNLKNVLKFLSLEQESFIP